MLGWDWRGKVGGRGSVGPGQRMRLWKGERRCKMGMTLKGWVADDPLWGPGWLG